MIIFFTPPTSLITQLSTLMVAPVNSFAASSAKEEPKATSTLAEPSVTLPVNFLSLILTILLTCGPAAGRQIQTQARV
jgi:hypothetical protein